MATTARTASLTFPSLRLGMAKFSWQCGPSASIHSITRFARATSMGQRPKTCHASAVRRGQAQSSRARAIPSTSAIACLSEGRVSASRPTALFCNTSSTAASNGPALPAEKSPVLWLVDRTRVWTGCSHRLVAQRVWHGRLYPRPVGDTRLFDQSRFDGRDLLLSRERRVPDERGHCDRRTGRKTGSRHRRGCLGLVCRGPRLLP